MSSHGHAPSVQIDRFFQSWPAFPQVRALRDVLVPNPRVSDEVKRRRGTFRPDRAEDAPAGDDRPEAVREYVGLGHAVYTRACKGGAVMAATETTMS
jgi:hypothetical protein